MAELTGAVVLVTGATSGIGAKTAALLAAGGARVILGGRDAARAAAVRQAMGGELAERVHPLVADLSSLAQVRRAAGEVRDRFGRLDVLINNAGIDTGVQRESVDGFEMTFAVNYLAPFVLTTSVVDLLRASAPSRVLNVASGGHRAGRIDLDDLQGRARFSGQRAYNNSKLALVLFSCELARRLAGSGVTVNCVDPGFVRGTNIGQDMALGYRLLGGLMWPLMTSPAKAAAGIAQAATDRALAGVSGAYLKNGKQTGSSPAGRDVQLAAQLWAATEQLLAATS